MSKPSGTNSPNDFLYRGPFSHPRIVKYTKEGVWVKRTLRYHVVSYNNVDLGGYSSGVPPLPIPNREVKPVHADGTAVTCGRVGSRLLRVLRVIGGLFFMRQKGWIKGPSVTDTTCPFLKVTRITGASSRSNEKWFEDRSVVRNPGLAGFQ